MTIMSAIWMECLSFATIMQHPYVHSDSLLCFDSGAWGLNELTYYWLIYGFIDFIDAS